MAIKGSHMTAVRQYGNQFGRVRRFYDSRWFRSHNNSFELNRLTGLRVIFVVQVGYATLNGSKRLDLILNLIRTKFIVAGKRFQWCIQISYDLIIILRKHIIISDPLTNHKKKTYFSLFSFVELKYEYSNLTKFG